MVAGAGNDATNAPFYPAAYPGVVAVAGTTSSDTKASYSNYGSWVSLSAPSDNILTTQSGGGYVSTSGTSLAAPFVSGMAGLLLSLHPGWTPALVRAQLMHTADGIDGLNPNYTDQLGSGRLDAARALTPPQPLLSFTGYSINGVGDARPNFGTTVPLSVTIYNDWEDATGVSGSLSTSDPDVTAITGNPASFGSIASAQTVAAQAPFMVTIAAAAGYNHTIAFQLALSANNGAYHASLPFAVTTRSNTTPAGGTYSGNTTWTSDQIYVVSGNNVGIPPGATLTIQPGTTVEFNAGLGFDVGGTLIAEGTAQQPIVFEPATSGGSWGNVLFDNTSPGATVDGQGAYSSGDILGYVQLQGAAGGVACNGSTPYLSHLTTDGGGIDCSPQGSGDFWLLDSAVAGSVTASGAGHVRGTTITGGGLSLGANSDVQASKVGGAASGSERAAARGTVPSAGRNGVAAPAATATPLPTPIGAGVAINGSGSVQSCTVAGGVSLSDGAVLSTTVTGGSISLGNGTVSGNQVTGGDINLAGGTLSGNTVQTGGLTAGAGVTAWSNDVENAPGTAIKAGAGASVVGNRVVGGAGAGIVTSTGLIQGNLIADTAGDGVQAGAATVVSNTFTGIAGRALYLNGGIPLKIQHNNFDLNPGPYDLYNDNDAGLGGVNAQGNWWGSASGAALARILRLRPQLPQGGRGHVGVPGRPGAGRAGLCALGRGEPKPGGHPDGELHRAVQPADGHIRPAIAILSRPAAGHMADVQFGQQRATG